MIVVFLSFCRTSESFSPICLPRYNPMAFLYAYVHYLDVSETAVDEFFARANLTLKILLNKRKTRLAIICV